MMSLHKLSAGDGYLYYTRSVAAHDSVEHGCHPLVDYYTARGESPGMWMGTGLVAFDEIHAGDTVTEEQMAALFGHGHHPDADAITPTVIAEQLAAGATVATPCPRAGIGIASPKHSGTGTPATASPATPRCPKRYGRGFAPK